MTVNATNMVDQIIAGYPQYRYYHAIERYYSGTQNGPHVSVYLSNTIPISISMTSASLGSGVRVDGYTSLTTNLGAQRHTVSSYGGGVLSWGVQEMVLSSANANLIGGVSIAYPASYNQEQYKANVAATYANIALVLLLVFVLVAQYWNIFRRR